jgi:hypothetical protein
MWAGIFAVVVGFSFALSLAAIVMQPDPDPKGSKLPSWP